MTSLFYIFIGLILMLTNFSTLFGGMIIVAFAVVFLGLLAGTLSGKYK